MSELTPMMRQYFEIKADYPDTILFFRLGDFYEMFYADAVKASKILEIALTSRNKSAEGDDVPLCGIPFHSASPYIAKLIDAGEKVAICEQVEDPKTAKGIVKREVVRVVTPGLIVDGDSLSPKENNYLLALSHSADERFGLAYLDVSTGEFRAGAIDSFEAVLAEVANLVPREFLLPASWKETALGRGLHTFTSGRVTTFLDEWVYDRDYGGRLFQEMFGVAKPADFGDEGMGEGLVAAAAIAHYLRDTFKSGVSHIRGITPYRTTDYLVLDESTRRNLELTATAAEGKRKGSLLWLLDRTATSMGGRKLRHWITSPLVNLQKIVERQDAVQELVEQFSTRRQLTDLLSGIHDLERLNGRISLASAGAKDLVALRNSLQQIPQVLEVMANVHSPLLLGLHHSIDPLDDMVLLITSAIIDDPPFVLRDGGIIADGYHGELDELRAISREGKGFIARLEAKERERTGISSLKIRYNKVFGYYIEVTKAHFASVPADYIRKQTLANAERFITAELKEYEDKVLGAEDRIVQLEYALFQEVRAMVAAQGERIARTADGLATLDVVASLADVAHDNGYCRPVLEDNDIISIVEGRHPVIEAMNLGERFVPNDVLLDTGENQLIILTGPNMAGKSTYMRQVALITLMAHIGTFVPAKEARIGLVDRIFTRVGASDNLARGESTFMVEMKETAAILRNATERSLIILDEIGRGTSTFDGISIAWAVAEFLHDTTGSAAKTLFATHYHELTELAVTRSRIKNYSVAVKEWNDQVVFLRKIVPGGASHSYGIQVARLAGLPPAVIERSKEILNNLEKGEYTEGGVPRIAKGKKQSTAPTSQLSLFSESDDRLRKRLQELDVSVLTPLAALNALDELKRMV